MNYILKIIKRSNEFISAKAKHIIDDLSKNRNHAISIVLLSICIVILFYIYEIPYDILGIFPFIYWWIFSHCEDSRYWKNKF
jgi:hypothetical protein